GVGMHANAGKAAEVVRQYVTKGTHPLDAMDPESGHPVVSGPKVSQYYSNYMTPERVTTDVWHARAMLGHKLRSTLTEEERAKKQKLKGTPEGNKLVIKTPLEQSLEQAGMHELSAHVTERAAK